MEKLINYSYYCKIINTVDGDTADLIIDLGFGIFKETRVRLVGVDTPERGEDGYIAAKEFLKSYEGIDLIMVSHKKGKYGRWLASLYELNSPVSINSEIVEKGLGFIYGKNI